MEGNGGGAPPASSHGGSSLLDRLTAAVHDLMSPDAGDSALAVAGAAERGGWGAPRAPLLSGRDAALVAGGALLQLWLPEPPAPGGGAAAAVLSTRGQPFAVSADGFGSARLAAFRAASARYAFAVEPAAAAGAAGAPAAPPAPSVAPAPPGAAQPPARPLGVPGVYLTGRAEVTPDVGLYTPDQYPRGADARQCGVRGTLAMPVCEGPGAAAAAAPSPGAPFGAPSAVRAVLEVATPSCDVDWGALMGRVASALAVRGLATCGPGGPGPGAAAAALAAVAAHPLAADTAR